MMTLTASPAPPLATPMQARAIDPQVVPNPRFMNDIWLMQVAESPNRFIINRCGCQGRLGGPSAVGCSWLLYPPAGCLPLRPHFTLARAHDSIGLPLLASSLCMPVVDTRLVVPTSLHKTISGSPPPTRLCKCSHCKQCPPCLPPLPLSAPSSSTG